MRLTYNNFTLEKWKILFSNPKNTTNFFLNLFFCCVFYFAVIQWMFHNAATPGSVLFDPLHKLFHPVKDLSFYINFFTYSSTLIALFIILQNPFQLHYLLQAFTAIYMIRMICVFLLPLSPDPFMVPLLDPFADAVAHENAILNDLFFSGHIATLTLFYFALRTSKWRYYMALCILAVSGMMIVQRIHYSADLLLAPFFAYTMYNLFVEKKIMPFFRLLPDTERLAEQTENQRIEIFF